MSIIFSLIGDLTHVQKQNEKVNVQIDDTKKQYTMLSKSLQSAEDQLQRATTV